MRGQFLEVVPGRERGSVGREHDRMDARLARKAIEFLLQRRQHRLRQAVAGLGAVESENRDIADVFPQ